MARPRKSNKHLPKYVTVNHGAYWYSAPHHKRIRICAEGDDQGLWKFMLDKATPVASSGPSTTLLEIFDRYEREILPSLAPRTQKDYRRHLKVLRQTFGHLKPDELEPRHIGAFLQRPKGKINANRQVAVLSAVYAKAVGRWYLAKSNPCVSVERNPQKRRDRYITDAEFIALYTLAPIRVRLAMDLAYLTGQRQGDILGLKWTDVTEDGIKFQQGKTGKKLIVGFSPALRDVLERCKALVPQLPREYVLRVRGTGKAYTGEGFRACWQRVMKKALRLGVVASRFTFHDLRAKCVSDSASLEAAFERAGHTTMAMTRGVYDRNYRKVTPLK